MAGASERQNVIVGRGPRSRPRGSSRRDPRPAIGRPRRPRRAGAAVPRFAGALRGAAPWSALPLPRPDPARWSRTSRRAGSDRSRPARWAAASNRLSFQCPPTRGWRGLFAPPRRSLEGRRCRSGSWRRGSVVRRVVVVELFEVPGDDPDLVTSDLWRQANQRDERPDSHESIDSYSNLRSRLSNRAAGGS